MRKSFQNLLLVIAIQVVAFFFTPLSAQKLKTADVPADVTQTLEFQYPYVKVVGWAKDGNNYVASVKDEGTNGKVVISEEGQWLYTHFFIPRNELPPTVTEYVKTNYPDFVVSVSCLQEKEDEKAQYYLEVKPDAVGAKPSVLLFSTIGRNELLSRTDPEDFQDPLAEAEKPAARTPSPKPEKEVVEKEPKPEKPKKEKPVEVVSDEFGNEAIAASEVPEIVVKSLTKKVLHPEELNWFLTDSGYVAKCVYSGKKTAVYIKPDGFWNKTLTVLPEEAVTGPMLKHLNDFYKGFKFKMAIREQRADKQDKTLVDFYEKANFKTKLVTTVIFDKSGKLLQTIHPEDQMDEGNPQSLTEDAALDMYSERVNMTAEKEDNKGIPEPVKAAFKLKYPRATNVEWKEDDDMNYQAIFFSAKGKEVCVFNSYGEIVETMLMGKLDNLSSTIQDYIKKNYKNYKATEFYTVRKVAERLNCYKVFITNKKTKEEDVLWFTTAGRPLE